MKKIALVIIIIIPIYLFSQDKGPAVEIATQTENYSIEFNSGHLPSGTYLYKLVAGEFIDSKKMMLVK